MLAMADDEPRRVGPPTFRFEPWPDEAENQPVREHLLGLGWEERRAGPATLRWNAYLPDRAAFAAVPPGGRINHFPGAEALWFKDSLHRLLRFARARATAEGRAADYAFAPEGYLLPGERARWDAAATADPGARWILKPPRGQLSEGLEVVASRDDADPGEDRLAQRYLDRPLLLPRYPHKHVLRIYVAVTSLAPLVVHVHRGHIVRFAARPYDPAADVLNDPLVHITYPPVLRERPELDGAVSAIDSWRHAEWLAEAGFDAEAVWQRLRDAIARTVIAGADAMLALSQRWMPDTRPCFELFGFDVLLDADARPMVCEANISPSIASPSAGPNESGVAVTVKAPMVADLLTLVGVRADGIDRVPELGAAGGWEPLVPGPDPSRYAADLAWRVMGEGASGPRGGAGRPGDRRSPTTTAGPDPMSRPAGSRPA